MPWLMVVLSDPLADLARSGANNWIEIGIVVRIPAKHLDSDGPLFELSGVPGKGVLHNVPQHARIAAAVLEQGIGQQQLKLFADGVPLGLGFRHPACNRIDLLN